MMGFNSLWDHQSQHQASGSFFPLKEERLGLFSHHFERGQEGFYMCISFSRFSFSNNYLPTVQRNLPSQGVLLMVVGMLYHRVPFYRIVESENRGYSNVERYNRS